MFDFRFENSSIDKVYWIRVNKKFVGRKAHFLAIGISQYSTQCFIYKNTGINCSIIDIKRLRMFDVANFNSQINAKIAITITLSYFLS